jgi:hypothetical protein
MRSLALALLAGCTIAGGPRKQTVPTMTDDMMPSEVLEHQDPGADTSNHPSTTVGGWSFGDFFRWPSAPASPFGSTGETPHYYTGCRGCGGSDPALCAGLALLALATRRRRG